MLRTMIVVGMLVGLAACSTVPSTVSSTDESYLDSSQPAASVPDDTMCNSTPVLSLIGQTLTPDLAETARKRSHSETTRVLRPGEVMTMEYNPARLNIILGKQDKVITIHCG